MSFNDEEKQIDAKLSAAWAQHRPAIIVVLALLLVSLVMCSRAHAGTATVSWTHPTTYTDGSALALTDISQTRIEYGTCAGTAFGTKAGEQIATGTATTVTIRGRHLVLPRLHHCQGRGVWPVRRCEQGRSAGCAESAHALHHHHGGLLGHQVAHAVRAHSGRHRAAGDRLPVQHAARRAVRNSHQRRESSFQGRGVLGPVRVRKPLTPAEKLEQALQDIYNAQRHTVSLLLSINTKVNSIMATQDQLAADLTAISTQVAKIGEESKSTLAKVAELEAQLAAAGGTTPAVDAALAALKAQVQVVDDLVADAPAA